MGLLVIATVSVLLLKNTPLLARMVAVLLVFGACAGVALSVYSDGRSEHNANASLNSDCDITLVSGIAHGSWEFVWDFEEGTHKGSHLGGGHRTGEIIGVCSKKYLAVSLEKTSNTNNCNYFGTIVGDKVSGTYYCSGVNGAIPFNGGITRE